MSPVDVCALDELAPGTATKVDVAGLAVSLVRIDDDVYAIGDICSHGHVSLSEGEVWCEEREIECPKHGSLFSLATGDALTLPATQPVPVFEARVVDGRVHVSVTPTESEVAK
jgi:3-phenylpropionate/trans-cinnamate dioxygenase ferredoxin subunit